ncbi:sensor histidine kinase [Massilia sp. TS11]|uniref:sensor histidine kinase n=1 Tax=Massilia sp. TS11 TaxID=2908003 RepID=UPI001EDAD099|nr:sensor histidine kinase [Massilia sp. TS11]MCG2582893.1 histidine kinase [Massilia sp. TS11]
MSRLRNAELAAALQQAQARLDAIVRNTPGLVYQFRLYRDGSIAFPYVSDACEALLGLTQYEMQRQPALFLELILPEDRASYLQSMEISAANKTTWNWEGRIWIESWQDVKWINLRATPHALIQPHWTIQWEGIMTNITASKIAAEQARQSRARLAELTAHIEQAKEEERTRIAREIHDDLGGNLTAIKMALAMLADRLPPELPALRDKADYVESLVDRTIDAIHRITHDLRPSVLDLGLVAALEWQCREFEKQVGIPCTLSTSDKELDLPPEQATALFRIFQEALTNIAKHARASRVEVRLLRQRQQLSLDIADDGRGIAPADRLKPHSFGLRGMAERAKALGGKMSLATGAAGGTIVGIKLKLSQRQHD